MWKTDRQNEKAESQSGTLRLQPASPLVPHLILFLINSTVGTTGLWTSYTPGPTSRPYLDSAKARTISSSERLFSMVSTSAARAGCKG